MRRREFITGSVAAATLAGIPGAKAQTTAGSTGRHPGNREYYELRVYRLKSDANRTLLDQYLSKALLPALSRAGSKPVGVFTQQQRAGTTPKTEVTDPLSVLVLIPYPSVEAFSGAAGRVNDDAEYQAAGAEYLQSPKASPAFERIDSWLMRAFSGMPKVELPAYSRERKPRMFELRTYESHSELKALKKVDMFNSGEIQLMRDVGLGPIFYGQALIGSDLPHLTYMLSAEDEAAHTKHWDAFKASPIWDKMSHDPQYADTVSKITNRFLVPTEYSQI